MVEKEHSKQPTHRAYTVIKRDGQDDFWLNIGLVFTHKNDDGFSILLQALPLDGRIVCRGITEDDRSERRSDTNQRGESHEDHVRNRPSRHPR
jgi:hypothetical protein